MESGTTVGLDDKKRRPGFVARHRSSVTAGLAGLLILAGIAYLATRTARQPPVRLIQTITIMRVQPQKPPPPPPPPPPQQMIAQPKITMPLPKPTQPAPPTKVAVPKAAAPAAPPMSTSIHSNAAPDSFNLAGSGNGDSLLGGGGGDGGSGAWSYYGSQMQSQIDQALHADNATTRATFEVTARLWLDRSGHPVRVTVTPSGDPAVDSAIRDRVLAGENFGAPPVGMPMPITISLKGQQPL